MQCIAFALYVRIRQISTIHHDILKSVICYWYRLENLNKFKLLKDAYLRSKSLHFDNKLSWYSLVQKALEYFEIEHQSLA
jgi:hypothetical protein